VHVYEKTVLHSVVPVGAFDSVAYTSPEETAQKLRDNQVVIPLSLTAPAVDDVDTRPVELAGLL